MAMNQAETAVNASDLGPLAWVLDETRKSIEAATKSLKRFSHDTEAAMGVDMVSMDASHLRVARQQLHQVVGALEMVGQDVAAQMARAMEAAVQQCVQRPEKCTSSAVQTLESAGFALTEYLESQLGEKPRPALGLFPQFRKVQEMAGADRIFPADLWSFTWRWADPQTPSALQKIQYGAEVRTGLDQRVLKIMKHGDVDAAAELSEMTLGLADGEEHRQPRVFWKLAAAFFEALAKSLVSMDMYAKRTASRILIQYAALARGENTVPERQVLDLLFFSSQAKPKTPEQAPLVAAVRQAWGLSRHQPVDYEAPIFGLYDPNVLAQARRRVDAVKENWSALAGGDMARLKACVDQFGLVVESLLKLHANSKPLADALAHVATLVAQSGQPPSPELAMETATAVLFLEASFAEFEPADARFAQRLTQLAQRLESVIQGGAAPALEPWMEELYRSVSDRQTMGTVVDELRATLGEAEQHLDQFFRNPQDKHQLETVPSLLTQMKGVLSVLGMDQASLAVGRMRDSVDRWLHDEGSFADSQADGEVDRLGSTLGALGFLVDTLGYQPVLARKLFVYDEATGELRHVSGRIHADTASAGSDEPEVDQVPGTHDVATEASPMAEEHVDLPEVPAEASQAAEPSPAAELAEAAVPAPSSQPTMPASGEEEELDEELLDIFLEEAREVVQNGKAALVELATVPADIEQQTTLRRAFHTLKGSSRMVGLSEFGEAAWSMEQLLNAWLAEQKPASEELRSLADEAMTAFSQWIEDIAAKRAGHWQAQPFALAADALRTEGRRLPLVIQVAGDAPLADADVSVVPVAQPVVVEAPESQVSADGPAAMTDPAQEVDVFAEGSEAVVDVETVADDASAVAPALTLDLDSLDLPDLDVTESDKATDVVDVQALDIQDIVTPDLSLEGDVTEVEAASGDEWLEEALAASGPDLLGPLEEATVPSETLLPPEDETDTPSLDALSLSLDATEDSSQDLSVPDIAGMEVAELSDLPVDVEELGLPDPAVQEPSLPDMGAQAQDEEVSEQTEITEANASGTAAVDDLLALDLGELNFATEDADALQPEREDEYKQIGDLRISAPLYNIYLLEADEWARHLDAEISDWRRQLSRPVPEIAIARAHSLAGSSATVGFAALSSMARAVEHALERLHGQPYNSAEQVDLLQTAASDIRQVVQRFALGELKLPDADLLAKIQALEPTSAAAEDVPESVAESRADQQSPGSSPDAEHARAAVLGDVAGMPASAQPSSGAGKASLPAQEQKYSITDEIDAQDAIDPDLFPIFEEEAEELFPALSASVREWVGQPLSAEPRAQVLRVLHTLKGSARLAGALRLGEMAHRTESAIETIGIEGLTESDLLPIQEYVDELQSAFRRLQQGEQDTGYQALPTVDGQVAAPAQQAEAVEGAPLVPATLPLATGEVARPVPLSMVSVRAAASQAVRVRSQLLDRLVAQAGEVVTSRARLETEMLQLRTSLNEMTSNLERLRQQLRDVELQAETQMQSRLALNKDAQQNFDPLEFDRFTRMQELTRMMAESVNDMATVQRSVQRAVEASENDLAVQARQSRELQRDLLRTRMMEFEGISERLYRVVRQASKETGKQVRLDIAGGSIEMDRGILDRMTPAFEHILRNCVVHGIENQAMRAARSKDPVGLISIEVQQSGNDVLVKFTDDGAGLNLARIRERAVELGLITSDQQLSDSEIGNLIFAAGFSTATEVSELAGRGVGMDVVRTEVRALGGRIETATQEGRGSSFQLILPLTTAVTHVVMIRCGKLVVGVPSNLVEIVQRVSAKDLERAYESGSYAYGDAALPFFWSGALFQHSARSEEAPARSTPVVVFRSAAQRVALHVDEVLGNQEVVVKGLGAQLSRLPGLVAITALASGAVALIYNPVALAAVYGQQAKDLMLKANEPAPVVDGASSVVAGAAAHSDIPLVLVVDDSITVRRVTQRLLQREGYRVALAADGLQGLERLQQERPAVVLSDIEMPRMDGFDFVRNIRADESLADLPVIMITSRIAEKHRDHARELGVSHYLGKPYSEEQLLGLIKEYAQAAARQSA